MNILLYNDKCDNCKKILLYINNNNLTINFKLLNINLKNNEKKKKFDNFILPLVIDKKLTKPIDGNNIIEYLKNLKYFNNPTNNIEFINYNFINKPNIEEDSKALSNNNNYLNIL